MGRKKLIEDEEMSLEELIESYGIHKSEADDLKKICDKENKNLKSILKDRGLETSSSENWVVKYIIQNRESINEEMLLDILNKDWSVTSEMLGIIKTKQYIDFEALEKCIYKGQVPQEMVLTIDKAREVKQVETLRISKKKEK